MKEVIIRIDYTIRLEDIGYIQEVLEKMRETGDADITDLQVITKKKKSISQDQKEDE